MKTEPNDSAFTIDAGIIDQCGDKPSPFGLTKREYIAARAMQGLIASPKINITEPADAQRLAKVAIHMTDALIAELNKP